LARAEPGKASEREASHSYGLLHLRQGHEEAARQALAEIRVEEIKDNAEALMQVAQVRAQLGLPGVLPLIYQARRLDFNNPSMHLAYITLFLQRDEPDRTLLEPTVVEPDCTVHLVHEDEKQTFTILGTDAGDLRAGELTVTRPLAMKLL